VYLSHPVRRIRDDPTPGESVELVLELAEGAPVAPLRRAVEALDGRVIEELRFADLRVVVPEPAVEDLCALDDVVRVETGNVLGLGLAPDAAAPAGATPDDRSTDADPR
jgi:hypothetical protein